jgi:hypothetical protein
MCACRLGCELMVTFRTTPRRHDTVDTSDDSVAVKGIAHSAAGTRFGLAAPLSQTGDLTPALSATGAHSRAKSSHARRVRGLPVPALHGS